LIDSAVDNPVSRRPQNVLEGRGAARSGRISRITRSCLASISCRSRQPL